LLEIDVEVCERSSASSTHSNPIADGAGDPGRISVRGALSPAFTDEVPSHVRFASGTQRAVRVEEHTDARTRGGRPVK
jgi:hypothetical protein